MHVPVGSAAWKDYYIDVYAYKWKGMPRPDPSLRGIPSFQHSVRPCFSDDLPNNNPDF
jgi:hypothetical protein